jgi:hypothetical protein
VICCIWHQISVIHIHRAKGLACSVLRGVAPVFRGSGRSHWGFGGLASDIRIFIIISLVNTEACVTPESLRRCEFPPDSRIILPVHEIHALGFGIADTTPHQSLTQSRAKLFKVLPGPHVHLLCASAHTKQVLHFSCMLGDTRPLLLANFESRLDLPGDRLHIIISF